MSHLAAEAAAQHVLLREGLVSAAEVVAWADAWIVRLPELPGPLMDLSLSHANANEVLGALGLLAAPELTPAGFQSLCRMLLGGLHSGQWTLTQVNKLLWRLHYDDVDGTRRFQGEKLEEMYWFHECETLIPDGYINMTLAELRRDVEHFLAVHANG